MTDVAIVAAARTPIGSFNGALASQDAHELGSVAVAGALKRSGVEPGEVDEVAMGQILQAGEGPKSGVAGLDRRRHSCRKPRLEPRNRRGLIPEVDILQGLCDLLALDQRDHGLQIIALFA